jgi:hypothetical protein
MESCETPKDAKISKATFDMTPSEYKKHKNI